MATNSNLPDRFTVIEIGGRVWRLLFDFNAMARMEEAINHDVLNVRFWRNFGARDARAMLWASMLHEEPELTIEQVGSMVTMKNLAMVVKACHAAWTNAMAEMGEADGAGSDPKAPGGSSGSKSGPTLV
ncbi:hypothetical protein LCGC14_1234800 [marine sediment metagenome]|uniref:Uncharacterized protein n=1 Tax=marine sediment metagenome TaxID=412755 RepID=A0A0F9LBP4_9ZZZZ